MAKLIIKPVKKLSGDITIPGDKSISHRAIMLGAIAEGVTKVEHFLAGEDCLATIHCFHQLGIDIKQKGTDITVHGKGLSGLIRSKKALNVGNSGTTIRILSGILAGQGFETEITGDASIQKRPMKRVADPLMQMGAQITGRNEKENIFPPLKISGAELKSIKYKLPVASAQVKSAILLAGLFAKGITKVIEPTVSRDHTERMLEFFGARITREEKTIGIKGGQKLKAQKVIVPGDISSAAFFMVAGLIVPHSALRILGVGVNSTRTGILEVMHRMGADFEVDDEIDICEEPRANIRTQSTELRALTIGGELIPRLIDEIPIIAVLATQAKGVTVIKDAQELRVKESDRIKTISSELRKMGASIIERPDGMEIVGPTKLKGTHVKSYGDHRVAMSLAIAGLIAEGQTEIENTDCIETSFPGFGKLLGKISA